MVVWKIICTARPSQKLDYKCYGPFEVRDCIGLQTYHLHLSKTIGKIHDVFHVSLLEPYKPDSQGASAPPLPIEVKGKDKYKAKAILDSKCIDSKMSYYVK
jgi:hypothetical protein